MTEQKEAKSPFAYFFDFKKEIVHMQKLNPIVIKTVYHDKDSLKTKGFIDWDKEFSVFTSADINHAKFKDSYQISTEQTKTGKNVIYTATDSTAVTKKVFLHFEGNDCKKILILKSSSTPFFDFRQKLIYYPGSSYEILIEQHTAVQSSHYRITGKIIRPDTLWHAEFILKNQTLPFNFSFDRNKKKMILINGDERIEVSDIDYYGDSVNIHFPAFDTEIRGYYSDSTMQGFWYDHTRGKDYKIPFKARSGRNYRFKSTHCADAFDFSGRWEVWFSKGSDNAYKAIGVFHQEGKKITGTFLTETGDYRYLEGYACNNTLELSAFDGNHVFLFKAAIDSSMHLSGRFWSGIHCEERWEAVKNPFAVLKNPYSLTSVKDKKQPFRFSFPDTDSNIVTFDDPSFAKKVLIVEIMGTWCSNCKDETSFLAELYNRYHEKGLEIVAIAYERYTDFKKAVRSVNIHRKSLGAEYRFLIGGKADKQIASDDFPMLNRIIAFPTAIFIDRNKKVRSIYTGFYGPGTGNYYKKFEAETDSLINVLIGES